MNTNRPRLLDAQLIHDALMEVANSLKPDGPQQTLLLVGGAVLALEGLRDMTEDIDSISLFRADMSSTIAEVANKLNLHSKWLNNAARAFAPEAIDHSSCVVVLEHPQLRVLAISKRQLFLMKIDEARERDIQDLMLLWSHTGFQHVDEVLREYELAYPHAQRDEFLGAWIQQIIDRAEGVL